MATITTLLLISMVQDSQRRFWEQAFPTLEASPINTITYPTTDHTFSHTFELKLEGGELFSVFIHEQNPQPNSQRILTFNPNTTQMISTEFGGRTFDASKSTLVNVTKDHYITVSTLHRFDSKWHADLAIRVKALGYAISVAYGIAAKPDASVLINNSEVPTVKFRGQIYVELSSFSDRSNQSVIFNTDGKIKVGAKVFTPGQILNGIPNLIIQNESFYIPFESTISVSN